MCHTLFYVVLEDKLKHQMVILRLRLRSSFIRELDHTINLTFVTKISIRKLRTQSLTLLLSSDTKWTSSWKGNQNPMKNEQIVSMDTICPKIRRLLLVNQVQTIPHTSKFGQVLYRSMNGTHYRHLLISQSPNFLSWWWWWRYWNNEQWGCL